MDVERAQRGDDDEVGQDERPAAGPGAPEPAAHIGDKDADLDRQRAGERLRDRDRVAHLFLSQPALLADQFLFHLADERHRAAETDRAEPQKVQDDLLDRATLLF